MAAGEPDARTGAAPRSAAGPGARTTDAPPEAGQAVHGGDQDGQGRDGAAPSLFAPPAVSLPKGGGAVRGIGEKFSANPATGTGSLTIPLPVTPGRSGFGPSLALRYDSGAAHGPFGMGWSLGLPSVTRKTDKGLPTYDDAAESDVFILSDAEDLVPFLAADGTPERRRRTVGGRSYLVTRYRPGWRACTRGSNGGPRPAPVRRTGAPSAATTSPPSTARMPTRASPTRPTRRVGCSVG